MDQALPITARFENAHRYSERGQDFISGEIYEDVTGRFEDGRTIHTTYITREIEPDVFETRAGGVYLVTSWAI